MRGMIASRCSNSIPRYHTSMELSGLINLITLQMLKVIMRELEKKFGTKPKVRLMVLFVRLELEELFQGSVMLLRKKIKM